MYYLIEIKGWPVLVWLERRPPEGRYLVLERFDDVLMAVAGFHDAVERARSRRSPRRARHADVPGPAIPYAPAAAKTMSPRPPAAKNRATYDSDR